MPVPIVIDTNIIFSALQKSDSKFSQTILSTDHSFFICESTIVELFKHKERIVQFSQLDETEIIRFFYILLKHLNVFKESLISPSVRQEARTLCKIIDPTDTPQVALTLHLKGLLWTGDTRLKNALQKQNFTQFYTP